jgi:tetratricopeptide (TPR) repeat protein
MHRAVLGGLIIGLMASLGWAQPEPADTRNVIVIGAGQYLSAGADAIRLGRYDEGIRLTLIGLEHDSPSVMNRAAGLANLCAAHVAKEEPDAAIPYCNESLSLNGRNWRAYSNRSHAYLLKGMYEEAKLDNDAAAAISPNADHVEMVRGLINEQRLRPRITLGEHQ